VCGRDDDRRRLSFDLQVGRRTGVDDDHDGAVGGTTRVTIECEVR
jgi:hypothetical protein